MSYNPTIASNERPSTSRTKLNTNFARLKTLFGAGHQFNDSSDTTDGYHTLTKWTPQAKAGISTETVNQVFTNTVNANIGDLLFCRISNDYNGPISRLGNDAVLAAPDGVAKDLIDFAGLTYCFGMLSFLSVATSGPSTGSYGFRYNFIYWDGTALVSTNIQNSGARPGIQVTGSKLQLLASGTDYNVYWSFQPHAISPLS